MKFFVVTLFLDPSSPEDYQMNIEVSYGEALTSQAYSTNKVSVAMYPLCVEYLDEEGKLCKGGIISLSEDKLHDHQQIEEFEKKHLIFLENTFPMKLLVGNAAVMVLARSSGQGMSLPTCLK